MSMTLPPIRNVQRAKRNNSLWLFRAECVLCLSAFTDLGAMLHERHFCAAEFQFARVLRLVGKKNIAIRNSDDVSWLTLGSTIGWRSRGRARAFHNPVT